MYVANHKDKSFLIAFGSNLKKIREEKSITQAQLAIDCNFDVSVISRIERGAVNTSVLNLKLIAIALDIKIEVLFDFEKDLQS